MLGKDEKKWSEIAAKLHHELSKEEENDFKTRLSDNHFKSLYEDAEKIYTIFKGNPVAFNKSKTWRKIRKKTTIISLKQSLKSKFKYAAIFVIALNVGYFLHFIKKQDVHYSEISVSYGQMSQLKLSDGTKVWLNSGTSLRYPDRFGTKQRSVYLEGEAFFEVAEIPEKPFIVHMDDIRVKAVGTSFNISAYNEETNTSVTLVEGKVIINNQTGEEIAHLRPQQTYLKEKRDSGFVIMKNVNTHFYDSWKNGTIYFEDQTIEQIAYKLERWYNVEIIFADPSVKNYRFSGTILKNKPISQIMQVFELLLSLEFEQKINADSKDQIIIYKPNK